MSFKGISILALVSFLFVQFGRGIMRNISMELIFEFGQVVKEMSFKDISIFSYEGNFVKRS